MNCTKHDFSIKGYSKELNKTWTKCVNCNYKQYSIMVNKKVKEGMKKVYEGSIEEMEKPQPKQTWVSGCAGLITFGILIYVIYTLCS